MVAYTIIMGYHHCTAIWLSKMQDQNLLTLHWWTFVGDSSNIVTSIFAHKRSQYCDYGVMPLHSPVIMQDARTKRVNALLTLISRMGQQASNFPVYL